MALTKTPDERHYLRRDRLELLFCSVALPRFRGSHIVREMRRQLSEVELNRCAVV
jgi:hypothetical protein